MPRNQTDLKHVSGREMSPALIHALDHPLRRQALRCFKQRRPEWSPGELAKLLRVGLSHLSYHMRVLSELDVIEEVRTEPVRGSLRHFYASIVVDNKLVGIILDRTKEDDEGLNKMGGRRKKT